MDDLKERVRGVAEGALDRTGVSLVDVELSGTPRRHIVRVVIDKPGGVSVGDCARASRVLDDALEAGSVLPGSYVLEVSSPGLSRPLKKPAEFEYFVGRRIRVATREAIGNEWQFTGEIAEATPALVTLRRGEGDLLSIPYESIATAQLDPGLDDEQTGERRRERRAKRGRRRP